MKKKDYSVHKSKRKLLLSALGLSLAVGLTFNHSIPTLNAVTQDTVEITSQSDFNGKAKLVNHPVVKRERQLALEALINRWQENSLETIQAEINRQEEVGSLAYVVQWGDSLQNIAKIKDISIHALLEMNGLENPGQVKTGDILLGVLNNQEELVAGAWDDDWDDWDDDWDDDDWDDDWDDWDDDDWDDDDWDDYYDDLDDYDDDWDDWDDDDWDDDDWDDDYDDLDDYDDDWDDWDDDDWNDDDWDDYYDDLDDYYDDFDDWDDDWDNWDDDDWDDDDWDDYYDDLDDYYDDIDDWDDDERWIEYFYNDPTNIPGHRPSTEGAIPSPQANPRPENDLNNQTSTENTQNPNTPDPVASELPPVNPTQTNEGSVDTNAVLDIFHQLVNQERSLNGVHSLEYGSHLQTAAENRNNEITVQFSHERPNGQSFYTAPGFEQGGSTVGENLQQTYVSTNASPEEIAQELFTNWKNSPGHYENMMDSSYTDHALQIDTYQQGGNIIIYSTQVFSN